MKTPRQYMEQSVAVMRQSVQERRNDGKACPIVGAVIVFPDGTTKEACRGDLRDGDHAEFTLIERMLRDVRLDDCILYATLEPCAPGSRRAPKCSCAERITRARIKKVYVGIEDPDPTVDRKGIKFLQDNGIEVEMFELDLQEEIRRANAEFIDQALVRKTETEAIKPDIHLSFLENPTNSTVADIQGEALNHFCSFLQIAHSEQERNRDLEAAGILVSQGGEFKATEFGRLLFSRSSLQQARLLGTIHYAGGGEETRDFDPPLVLIPDAILQWLRDKLPNINDRSTARRTERLDPILEMAREGMVNAIVHRDYSINGAKCQVVVTPNTITIKSPGFPVSPITFEQLMSFNAPMLSRNPVLHYVFAKMKMAEERGLGLASLRKRATELGLPLPTYSFDDPYVVLTIYTTSDALISGFDAELIASLREDERGVLTAIAKSGQVSSGDLIATSGLTERTVQRILGHLLNLGMVRRLGSGRATRYEVIPK